MANPWFKFYGTEYLADQKMLALNATERSCWVTLLCYASQNNGFVKHLSEVTLMQQAGVNFMEEEWGRTVGVFKRFAELDMVKIEKDGSITVRNWAKRQETFLTGAERTQRYRSKKPSDSSVTSTSHPRHKSDAREEEIREEKKRIDKREKKPPKPENSLSFLSEIPETDLNDLSEKYKISPAGIKSKATDLKLYCQQKAKKYANYKAFLENALRSDKEKLQAKYPYQKVDKSPPPPEELTPEQLQRNAELRQGIGAMLKKKVPSSLT